jgi:hypothetical protein
LLEDLSDCLFRLAVLLRIVFPLQLEPVEAKARVESSSNGVKADVRHHENEVKVGVQFLESESNSGGEVAAACNVNSTIVSPESLQVR